MSQEAIATSVKVGFEASMRGGGSLPTWFTLRASLLSRGVPEGEADDLARRIRSELEQEHRP